MRRALAPLLGLTLLLAPGARANPTDPETVSGSVTVQTSGSQMDITQLTPQAIINWGSFSIGNGELVRILQPGPTATLLSRVTGQDPSLILGSLTATGRLFLLNPNGVFIGSGARIETAGLLVSTLGMSDSDFLNGNYRLAQDLSLPQAAVVNQGEIRVTDGGFVMLAAPLVSNEGLILARTGQVGLAAGTEVTVSFDAQGLMNFVLEGGAREPGTVLVPRDQVSELLGQLVEHPDLVEAGSIVEEGGQIRLSGAGGVLLQSGTIEAQAGRVRLDSGQTTVMAGEISADGIGPGSVGGDIRVLSQGTTVLSPSGHLSARGGEAGQGGFIEVSGKDFYLQGTTDLSAPGGVPGELLIDPPVINIVNGGGGTLDPGLPVILLADPSIPPNTLSELALEGVTSGTISLQGGQINIFDIADNEVSLQPGVSLNIDGFNDFNSSINFQDLNDRFTTSNGGGFDWVVQGSAQIGNLLAPGGIIRVVANGLTLEPINGGIVADTVLLNSGLGSLNTSAATPSGTVGVTADRLTVVGRDVMFFMADFLTVDVAQLTVFTELGVFIDNVRAPVAGNSSLTFNHIAGNSGAQAAIAWGPNPASGFLFGITGPDELSANLPATDLNMSFTRDVLITGVSANSVTLTTSTGRILDANPNPGADITATTLLGLKSPVGIGSPADPLELSGTERVVLNTEDGTLATTRATLVTSPNFLDVRTSGPVSLDGMAQLDFSAGNVLNATVPGDLAFTAPVVGLGAVNADNVVIESAGAILDQNGAATNITAASVDLTSTLSGAAISADVVATDLDVVGSAAQINLNQGQGAVDTLVVDNPDGSTTIGHDGSLRPQLNASVRSDSIAIAVNNGSLSVPNILAGGPVTLSATGDVQVGLITQSANAPISISAGGNILDQNAVGDADNSGHLEFGETNVSGDLQTLLSLSAGRSASLDVVRLGQLALDTGNAAINFESSPFGLRLGGQTTGTLDLTAVDMTFIDSVFLGQFTGQTVNITAPGILDDTGSSGRLTAQSASLTAGTVGNGFFDEPLQLDVRNLQMQSASAATAIHNLGDLNLISAVSTNTQPLGGIEITTTGDLTVGLVESNATERFLGLFVGGSVRDGNGAATNLRGPFALIEAGGGIGAPNDPIEYDGEFIVATSLADSVYLHAESASTRIRAQASGTGEVVLTAPRDIQLATTISPTNVTVTAGGSIFDGNDDTGLRDNILAQNAVLTAGGVIGEATNPLEVTLNGNPGVLTATAGGSQEGVSVSVNLGSGQLVLGNTPPGAVILNGADILDPLAPVTANLLTLAGSEAFDRSFRADLLSASFLAQDDPKLANTMEGVLYTYDVVFVVNAQSWLDVIRGSVVWEDFD